MVKIQVTLPTIEFELMPHQVDFVFDVTTPIVGFMGGMRTGKSVSAVHKAIYLSAIHRGKTGVLLSPTSGMTQRNLVPIFRDLANRYNLQIAGLEHKLPSRLEIKWGDKISVISLECSAENHDRLNGMTLAWAGLDEADKCMSGTAELAVEQMLFRTSDPTLPYPGQVFITSTPEGQAFMSNFFIEQAGPKKKLYSAAMTQNYLLSKDYIEKILETVPAHKRPAYVQGLPIAFNQDAVYADYDDELNHTDLTLADITGTDTVHVSFDLNLGGMSVIIGFDRDGKRYIVEEWMKLKDTEEVLERVKKQPWAKQALITCDPACTQVFPYIHRAGLRHKIMTAAPPIEWRITSVNRRFCDGNDRRHLFINTNKCKVLNKCLINQTYVNGQPDKKTKIPEAGTDISGPVDALGYLIYRDFPYRPLGGGAITIRGV